MRTKGGWLEVEATRIQPEWVDYNGHLNMAYYNVIFDLASDEFLALAGIDPDYRSQRLGTTMIVEAHLTWRREVFVDTPLRVRMRALARDSKRLVLWSELVEANEGWLAATSEQLYLHVDLGQRRASAFPEDVAATLDILVAEAAHLPAPELAGRRIALPSAR